MTLQGISDLSEVFTKHSQSSRQAISISPVGLFAEYYQYVGGWEGGGGEVRGDRGRIRDKTTIK